MQFTEYLCPPQTIPVEILSFNMMILGGGVYGNWLGHEKNPWVPLPTSSCIIREDKICDNHQPIALCLSN
jgi:hypothetical protein